MARKRHQNRFRPQYLQRPRTQSGVRARRRWQLPDHPIFHFRQPVQTGLQQQHRRLQQPLPRHHPLLQALIRVGSAVLRGITSLRYLHGQRPLEQRRPRLPPLRQDQQRRSQQGLLHCHPQLRREHSAVRRNLSQRRLWPHHR